MKERLYWEEGALWSFEDLHRQWPWGNNRSFKRQGTMWARIHRALRPDAPDLNLVRGLAAQAIKVTWQVAYDSGSYDLAWTFFPMDDPVQPNVRDFMPPPMHLADPFMSLADPGELASGMTYFRDVSSLSRARADRNKLWNQERPGGGNDEKTEKPGAAPKGGAKPGAKAGAKKEKGDAPDH